MNAKKLIAAAKGLKEVFFVNKPIVEVCDHILATVREDDSELVTPEWLESQGFVNADEGEHCKTYVCADDGFAIQCHPLPMQQLTLCHESPTRGQVRILLRALGEEVKE